MRFWKETVAYFLAGGSLALVSGAGVHLIWGEVSNWINVAVGIISGIIAGALLNRFVFNDDDDDLDQGTTGTGVSTATKQPDNEEDDKQ